MDRPTLLIGIFGLLKFAAGGNPCEGMSVGFCDLDESQIVAKHPYNELLCHKLCTLDDQCLFWRHDSEQAGTEEECLFLKTDYHQDCKSIASPIDGDLTACSNVDQSSCDSILPENCDYTGDRLTDIEPGPGHTGSIDECFEYASLLADFGVIYLAYLIETEDCQLFSSWSQTCTATGGPASAPEGCAEEPSVCADDWDLFDSNCYKLIEEDLDWEGARAKCEESGAQLASIHSSAENNFVFNMIGNGWSWLGGNDIDGTYMWTDGTAWSYDNWGPGQPDIDAVDPEHCVTIGQLNEREKWNNDGCTEQSQSVCKRKL